jgi:hypothetical protein
MMKSKNDEVIWLIYPATMTETVRARVSKFPTTIFFLAVENLENEKTTSGGLSGGRKGDSYGRGLRR